VCRAAPAAPHTGGTSQVRGVPPSHAHTTPPPVTRGCPSYVGTHKRNTASVLMHRLSRRANETHSNAAFVYTDAHVLGAGSAPPKQRKHACRCRCTRGQQDCFWPVPACTTAFLPRTMPAALG
jgi:hypothetical protein